ncbi:MAG: hypothetical protein KDD43_16300, partial [Bdellovibrionales bacterium]|nr:hypothetical protein [Bdellovibrionales bacterium]
MGTSKDDDLKKKYGVDEEKMEETGALTERHLDLRSLTGEELDHLSLSTEVGVAEERVRAQASGDQVQAQGSAPAAKGAGELLADKKKQQQSTKRKRKPMSGLLVPLLFVV